MTDTEATQATTEVSLLIDCCIFSSKPMLANTTGRSNGKKACHERTGRIHSALSRLV